MADNKAPQDPFEMFRRLWGPLGVPVPGMAMPTLDPAEVEKRITDLRSVEGWLTMNLNMVKLSIQGLEMQKIALQAMRVATDAMGHGTGNAAEGAKAQEGAMNSMLWPWAAMQQAMGNMPVAPQAPDEKKPE
jgi:hypothetical protein